MGHNSACFCSNAIVYCPTSIDGQRLNLVWIDSDAKEHVLKHLHEQVYQMPDGSDIDITAFLNKIPVSLKWHPTSGGIMPFAFGPTGDIPAPRGIAGTRIGPAPLNNPLTRWEHAVDNPQLGPPVNHNA